MHPENIYPSPDDHGHSPTPPQQHITGIEPAASHVPVPHVSPPQPVSYSDLSQSPTPAQAPTPDWPTDDTAKSTDDQPLAVVKVLSVRGVEYGMMTIALWVAASSLAGAILNLVNGGGGFDAVVVPVSALVICLPIFGVLFLRLKKAELRDPNLRKDPSKRRWSQTTQFLAYISLLINLIYFVYTLLQKASGNKGPSIGKSLINLVVIMAVAGGILAYYWFDEHRNRKS